MRKKKILFFVEAMGGGVFTYITNLANGLSKEFDVYVAYATRTQTPKDYKKYFNNDVHLIKVKNFDRKISFKDIKAFFEMKKICKVVKPDIIHLHSSKAGILGRWAFNGKKIPLFYTPHGYSFLMTNISKLKGKFYRILEKVSACRLCTTISCSYGENLETKKLTKKALYVDNGINIEKIDKLLENKKTTVSKKPIIFTIGRISVQKNPILFNKIAEQFNNFDFVWIGDGQLRDKLSSTNIKITGWKNEKQVLEMIRKYDIFLLTSKWEGLPMSLLEAMYMKKTCIVSNVIGNNNVIKDGVNGYTCNGLNDFCNKISDTLISNTECIRDRAYKDVINHYNSIVMVNQYRAIYEEALR
ncbi:glycosyltransferase [Limosilactobacillus reuteri]|uniref:glycosyltransferase n=1 Tax=Limosilactobacillus reuteri TaxID=1598 RepID=UPI000A1E4AF6|nr:glycosyltransferase [Limosilactobacillus reuteri]